MIEVELELTYLVRELPPELLKAPSKNIVDIYYPLEIDHSCLRIRQHGDKYEITKKVLVDGTDSSFQHEHTIKLTAEEFAALVKAPGKKVAKRRYYYDYKGRLAEVDIFLDDLQGLVLVDFEFTSREDQLAFTMPDFCLAEVTQEAFIAGGKLAGKTLAQIMPDLKKYSYKNIEL